MSMGGGRSMEGKGPAGHGSDSRKRMFLLILFAFIFLSISSTFAEAAVRDSIRNGWSHMRTYVLSGPFWINTLIIFAVGFILYTILIAKSMGGGDNSTKIMMYIVLALIAIVIATKFVGANGAPEYIWNNDQFRNFTRFLIGPRESLGACSGSHSGIRAWLGWEPNPPCCGTGAYFTSAGGQRVCKQAILRTNQNGTGLPALIIGFLALYLLFGAYGSKLGFDRMGSSGGKWFPIMLSLILAAMIANDRIPKNHILMIAGWVAFLLIGNALSKSFAGDDKKSSKKGLGFGLAYALVQLVLNMLGTSLWGTSVNASDFGSSTVVWNLLIGIGLGYLYSYMSSGNGIWKKVSDELRKKKEKDIEELAKRGEMRKALLRTIPIFGKHWSPKDEAEALKKKVKEITEELEMINRLYRVSPAPNAAQRAEIDSKVARLQDKIKDALKKNL
ncbi:hypothetical protein JW898_00530 [Candidatus Woesearchaeota archaeon]|nr:hypothetical protein [Candidatus Woesearchaeota archaeon]